MRGQALVEFALVMPILMFMLLGFGEAAILFAQRWGYQNGVDVMAQWAAVDMSASPGESWKSGFNRIVDEEAEQWGCLDQDGPEVSFPDGTHEAGDRVLVAWDCTYEPKLTPALGIEVPIRVESEAVVPYVAPPAPSPSSSP